MIASFIVVALIVLSILGIAVGIVVYLVIAACVLLIRHCYHDYKKQGGAPTLAKKAGAQAAGQLARHAIKMWMK